MIKGRFLTRATFNGVVCPECKQWYARNTMVVINYERSDEFEVCVNCYEEKYFIPPEPLKKGDKQCLKSPVHP